MKPPQQIFPKEKEAEFDFEGRPFHPFFYCLKPNFYMKMFKLRDNMVAVNIFGARLRSQGKKPDPEQVLTVAKLAATRWVTREELNKIVLEEVTEVEYADFITTLERLVEMPFSYRVKEELFEWRVDSHEMISQQKFVIPEFDEDGRALVECQAQRKSVFVQDISYFFSQKERHQLLYPLQFTKMLGLVDIKATVRNGGPSGQAGALRYGISMCLRSFVDKKIADDMKLC